jgi:magnesium-protoporphyrin IX monomethyl ester (oxidative) cyclase
MAAVMRMASVAPVRGAAKLSKASRTRTATLAAPKGLRGASLKVRAAADVDTETGIKKMRDGIKEASDENLLTPRFYTTDFDEMEQLFSTEINPNLDEAELVAILQEFREDFNQKHFVRNDSFKSAADGITGESRRIFIEFLERSCTAEFSGFLLYKELGRRLKKTAPVAAEIFTLMSRDEARHAGFLNKAMSDFNLALDLGFLTKNRQVRSAPRTFSPSRRRERRVPDRVTDNFPLLESLLFLSSNRFLPRPRGSFRHEVSS